MPQHHALVNGLYVITDEQLTPPSTLLSQVEKALLGGAKWVQFRNKNGNYATQLEQARQLKGLCDHYQAGLIINDNIQLAKEVEAQGVHLGKNDASLLEARRLLGSKAIIGVSCYNDIDRAINMQHLGANYIALGRFFSSNTKPQAPQADFATLRSLKSILSIPIVCIGGINSTNANYLITAGCDSVAIIGAAFASSNITQNCQAIAQQFKTIQKKTNYSVHLKGPYYDNFT